MSLVMRVYSQRDVLGTLHDDHLHEGTCEGVVPGIEPKQEGRRVRLKREVPYRIQSYDDVTYTIRSKINVSLMSIGDAQSLPSSD